MRQTSSPPVSDGAPAAMLGMDSSCKSTKGISIAVVDANAIIEGLHSLPNFADRFVTVPEVYSEIRDPTFRRRLDFIPFTIDAMEPSPESRIKVKEFARATGDLETLSDVDLELIALTYTLEAQVHGTKNIRDVPPLRVKELSDIEVEAEASSIEDDGNNSKQSWSESSVACIIASDYAMQNVILQMGLRLLAPGGMQIRQLDRWILKCHACYTVTPEIGKIFCPKCGNGGTLRKVAVTIGENGSIIAARKPRISLRGTKYSTQGKQLLKA